MLSTNYILNGDMEFRGAFSKGQTTSVSTEAIKGFDFSLSNCGIWTISREKDAPEPFRSALKLECTEHHSLGDQDEREAVLFSKIGGLNLQHLIKKTSTSNQVFLKFRVKSNFEGTLQVNLSTFPAQIENLEQRKVIGRAYKVDGKCEWQTVQLSFPFDGEELFGREKNAGLLVEFWLASGKSKSKGSFPEDWQPIKDSCRNSSTAKFDEPPNFWMLTGVQLSAGSAPEGYEFLDRSQFDFVWEANNVVFEEPKAANLDKGKAPLGSKRKTPKKHHTNSNSDTVILLDDVNIRIAVHSQENLSLRRALLGKSAPASYVDVLKNMDLKVNKGERVGLFGPNGSGKTSLLRCIAGAYIPTSGNIHVNGQVVSFVDINLGLDPEASGRKNIKLKLGLHSSEFMLDQSLAEEIIEFSGLGEAIDMPLRTYSTGMAMRLAFSIATSVPGDIYLMDEWLSVGDAEFNEKAQSRIRTLIGRETTMIIASHNLQLLANNCDKIYQLNDGRAVGQM